MRYIAVIFCFLYDWGSFTEIPSMSHVKRYDVVRLQRLHENSVNEQVTKLLKAFGGIGVRRFLNLESNKHEKYPEKLLYELFFNGNNHTVHLQKNRLLIGHNYTEIHYEADGSTRMTSPKLEDHCYYHGHIDGMEDSSVSVGICSGMRGFVRAEKHMMYLIEPLSDSIDGDHAFYKQEYLRRKRSANGDSGVAIYDPERTVAALFKRSSWKGRTAFQTQRYVELFLVVDNTEYRRFRSNDERVRARMLEAINHVDKFYRPHNIRVLLVGLEVWNVEDQIVVSASDNITLTRFIEWREKDLLSRVKHDNAQLVTGADFLGSTVGLANKFAMCTKASGGVNQDHSTSPLGLAATIAHEMGHNMGMSHDVQGCTCGLSDCIMTEVVNSAAAVFPELFSDCSLEDLRIFLENANPGCLLDRPSSDRLYGGPVCGNALLDPGEDCDCGTVDECNSPCCNAKTCKFTNGSRCAHGECCENCQIKQAGSLCRAVVNECDLEEYCTGMSEKCPEDSFKMNGILCSYGDSYCYNGQCPTHLQHCKRLWGKDAKVGSSVCFFRNTFGKNDSHCGRSKYGYRRCAKQDIYCGSIFCTGGNKFPITGLKAQLLTNTGEICNIVGERSEEENLSMVPTGTKCGPNKVCFDNMCQDVKVYDVSVDCSGKCHGHGVCDHQKRCQCEPGWAPPYCDVKYADVPAAKNTTILIVSVAAGVLLVLAAGFGSWIYCKKRKDTGSRRKRKADPEFVKNRPNIGEPTLISSTATKPNFSHTCTPTRTAPQPPLKNMAQQPPYTAPSISLPIEMKPLPPSKPPRPAGAKQVNRPPCPPLALENSKRYIL
ncbi:zinc metalloproteinase-disintegrin-like jararhagin isoform X2 [Silurus meridionalis]|uniref:zinc metalloproteinase-disintegrin-like jararhagin isoform X2 n=1 Tax=Silurus meridionalis TaxID=175797 RepID=UPI001EEAD519|nr:zinc metalloproteinase-disintegrin-like jararhagin isoform X2 [Silurus meridionalis]